MSFALRISNLSDRAFGFAWMAILLSFLLIHHFIGFSGPFGYDDMWYAKIAHELNNGQFDLIQDHYTYRWTLVFPLALFYRLFGVSTYTSALPSLIYTMGTLYLMYKMVKGRIPFVLATSFVVFNGWYSFYSDKIMPDVALTFFITAATYFVFSTYGIGQENNGLPKDENTKKWIRNGLGLSLMILMAFMTKGTMVLFIPCIIIFAAWDLLFGERVHLKFWLTFLISMGVLLIGYFLLIHFLTGDWTSRFTAIVKNGYVNRCSYDLLPTETLLKRIGYEYWKMLFQSDMVAGFAWLIPFLFLVSKWGEGRQVKFFGLLTLLGFLCANFMSISITSYIPMCPDPRHFLYLLPIAGIGASSILHDLLKHKGKSRVLIFLMVFIVLDILSFSVGYIGTASVLAVFSLVLILKLVFPNWNNSWFAVIVVAGMIIHPIRNIIYAQTRNYNTQKNFIRALYHSNLTEAKSNTKLKSMVISNHAQCTIGDYILGFDNEHIQFIDFAQFDTTEIQYNGYSDFYLLKNGQTRILSKMGDSELPEFAVKPREKHELLKEDSKSISLFRLNVTDLKKYKNRKKLD